MYDPEIHNHDYQPIAASRYDIVNERPHVTIYSDGSFKPDINYGGYGTLMQCDGNGIVIYGGSASESNNRMELRAVLTALRRLTCPCDVTVVSDSEYVVKGLNGYIWNWASNNWLNTKRQPVANADLWQEMLGFCQVHFIKGHWIKGHAGHYENEICDRLATIGAFESAGMPIPQAKQAWYALERNKYPGAQDDETLPEYRIPDAEIRERVPRK